MSYFKVALGKNILQEFLIGLLNAEWQLDFKRILVKNWISYYETRRRKRSNGVLRR